MKIYSILFISFFSLAACANPSQEIENKANAESNELITDINELQEKIETLTKETDSAEWSANDSTIALKEKELNEVINDNTGEYVSTSNKLEVIEEDKETVPTQKIVHSKTTPQIDIVEDDEEIITETVVAEPVEEAPLHTTWDELTRKHISSSGKVNYEGFKKDKTNLEAYIKKLQANYKDLKSWSRNKRLAYWINVYNAVTVKLIVDNYPVKSIRDLKGGKPWDTKLITLGGKSYTLNNIENDIIRPRFNEPRIHFAVNCAAISCPKILNRAWTEDNIQRYLTKQTKAFLANSSQNTLSADAVKISKIFDWYKADFGTSNENIIKFINKYSDVQVGSSATVSYNEYNWKLNN